MKKEFTLAGSVEHAEILKENCRRAFTLAEILITLVVIGVIASLTIPAIISEYKKATTVAKLKKAYVTVSNGFKLSEAQNGNPVNWDMDNTDSKFFIEYIKPFYKDAKQCSNMTKCGYNNVSSYSQWLGDGYAMISNSNRTFFRIYNDIVVLYLISNNEIFIDIDGSSGKNKFGEDVFQFDYDINHNNIIPSNGNCTSNTKKGCAYKIMQNGWKIPSDYPVKF